MSKSAPYFPYNVKQATEGYTIEEVEIKNGCDDEKRHEPFRVVNLDS